MTAEFFKAIELGLKLSTRIYYGKDVSALPLMVSMTTEPESYIPTAVMLYAEIYDPCVVDNPNVPSYQPYVHGRCEPPALIPLHMHGVSMKVDCHLDMAFVTICGTWHVHCVRASTTCNCRIALPMGEQGSVLGVEVEIPSKSYRIELVSSEATIELEDSKDGVLIRGRLYTLKIPQVEGGTELCVRISWSQKLLYQDGKFSLNVPFTFPSYVMPVMKKLSKKESILVNVNSGMGTEISSECCSHPLKVTSSDIATGVLLQSPSLHDYDQREMFCFYVYPGKKKVFRKELVFVVDISASMRGSPLENVKTTLLAALLNLNPVDTFNIIAFSENSSSFSTSMVSATKEVIEKASDWIKMNFTAGGSTNISNPLNQAIDMVSETSGVLPIIFLITDGSVEDEKDICEAMKHHLSKGGLRSPRIWTFGIGSYCNHYFLQMLAQIGRGYYDAAFDVDSVNVLLERLINNASKVILTDINIDTLKDLDSLEFHPFHIPDLSSGCPLFVSGRYCGKFPDFVEVGGTLSDSSSYVIQTKVQQAKDILLDRVTKLSLHSRVPSEYTRITLVETYSNLLSRKSDRIQKKITLLRSLGIGFGDLEATAENQPPESAEPKLYETQEKIFKAASDCCGRVLDCCCCMCFIQSCNRLKDQCAVALTQLCTVLACFGCIDVCFDLCLGPEDIYLSTSLASYLDKKLLVLLRDGRKLLGILRSFDQFANAVLEGACERVIVGDLYCDIPLGLYVIRGENVVLIGELDLEKEELPSHMTCVSPAEIRRAQKAERESSELKGTMKQRMDFLDMD
ncbi:hypothetical protein F511_18628 [Dorcoceras hygrometricum]|uniref:Uncharacterized protein n=1 Tax=Dorcoceras hygrometricum TaxID=472368 RepID=A0A2Z7DKK1_9LAMI|nr:hypothetical protein F511_18628 [Dorcoceras hygrometricum]